MFKVAAPLRRCESFGEDKIVALARVTNPVSLAVIFVAEWLCNVLTDTCIYQR